MSYSDVIQNLENELFKLNPENKKYYDLIEGLKGIERDNKIKEAQSNSSLTAHNGELIKTEYVKLVFDRQATAMEQILFALKYLGKVSKSGEILSAIKEFDPSFDKGLSTPYIKLKDAGLIDTFNPTITSENTEGSNHQVYYGLKEWFIDKNKPLDNYITQNLKD